MLKPDLLLKNIKNDEEALIIISALGNTISLWSFIKNIGGPKKALASDLFVNMLIKKAELYPEFAKNLDNLRSKLDIFYENKGFLYTPLNNNSRLFKITSAPLLFFGRFNRALVDTPSQVAVVGARDACERGLYWSKKLGESLAACSINLISGGALGIDSQAHKGALLAGGTTCVVSGLACSLSKKARILGDAFDSQRLVILYPFGPFFPQGKYMFVERNRYVAALADALIVVQGKEGSGTLHTAKFAKALKIPLFAVPGALDNPLSYVPNKLLQSGRARAIADFRHIDQALMTKGSKLPKKQKKEQEQEQELPETLKLIKNHGNALSMSQILTLSGRGFLEVQQELLQFELAGRVVKQGAQFVLTGR